MNDTASAIPLSGQFAEILISDLDAFVGGLQYLNNPETTILLEQARQRMDEENIIRQLPADVSSKGSMVAVDGGNNVLSIGAGTQCFVLAIAYFLNRDITPLFRMQRLHFDNSEPSGLMYGVRNAMEVELVSTVNESNSFCIVDNSWVSLLQTVNRTIDHYRSASEHDRDLIRPYLEQMLSHSGTFVQALQNPHNIAMSKSGVSNKYARRYTSDQLNIADKSFLLGILNAGEYTRPEALKTAVEGQLNVHPDDIFQTQEDVKGIYNSTLSSTGEHGLCLTYFRPHAWSPIKRIEFHRGLLRNSEQAFHTMLKTVAASMTIPTILEPLEQFLVDEVVKRHTGKLPGLYQTAGVANLRGIASSFAMQLTNRMRT